MRRQGALCGIRRNSTLWGEFMRRPVRVASRVTCLESVWNEAGIPERHGND
jgi:hypothetical protein